MWPVAALLATIMAVSPATGVDGDLALPAFEGQSEIRVTATAYTAGPESTGKRPGHPQYGITATGTVAMEGRTIAVDPSRIPLGSLVYIHELGQYRIAEDTGGAIRGDRVDLFMDQLSDAVEWGIRPLRIHIVPKI